MMKKRTSRSRQVLPLARELRPEPTTTRKLRGEMDPVTGYRIRWKTVLPLVILLLLFAGVFFLGFGVGHVGCCMRGC